MLPSTMNLNIAACLREQHDWAWTTVHNICTGSVYKVPWGGMDYVGPIIGISMTIIIVTFAATVINEIRKI